MKTDGPGLLAQGSTCPLTGCLGDLVTVVADHECRGMTCLWLVAGHKGIQFLDPMHQAVLYQEV
jgi:hypothetical protein